MRWSSSLRNRGMVCTSWSRYQTSTRLACTRASTVCPINCAGTEYVRWANHPHIAQIYGLEDSDGTHALVMELVEGQTLADRIAGSPLPVGDALPIAKQIADALEAAHEQGIIHRDLKPANIKVRDDGAVKVLDFGLAKAVDPVNATSTSASQSPTITSPAMTQMGMILGTAAYMSPEQAKGRPADRRSDLWSFGCVLYEMSTGRRAFDGEDISEVIANVLRAEPAWDALSGLPPNVTMVIRRCLEKDRRQRIGDAQDVRLALEGAFETLAPPASTPAPPRSQVPWGLVAAALVLGGLVVGAAATLIRPTETRTAEPVRRFEQTLPAREQLRARSGWTTDASRTSIGSEPSIRWRRITRRRRNGSRPRRPPPPS